MIDTCSDTTRSRRRNAPWLRGTGRGGAYLWPLNKQGNYLFFVFLFADDFLFVIHFRSAGRGRGGRRMRTPAGLRHIGSLPRTLGSLATTCSDLAPQASSRGRRPTAAKRVFRRQKVHSDGAAHASGKLGGVPMDSSRFSVLGVRERQR